MSKAASVKTPKNGPIERLYLAAREIVDGTRGVISREGRDAREVRIPILIHGTAMRITLEDGPAVAARNAIENAQMQASGKPVEPTIDMTAVLKEADALLGLYAADLMALARTVESGGAEHHRCLDTAKRCVDTVAGLREVERLV